MSFDQSDTHVPTLNLAFSSANASLRVIDMDPAARQATAGLYRRKREKQEPFLRNRSSNPIRFSLNMKIIGGTDEKSMVARVKSLRVSNPY